ncbi:MAG: enoyl-CoA hydratase, partial [Gammaproteobacteria bacterium]
TYSYLLSVRKPLLAAINGACAGLGFAVAMLCDMRFVERSAKFSTAFSQRGLIAEHGISWILPRLIGPSRALDLLWSARKFDGVEAERLGLADRLVEDGASLDAALGYIEELAASAAPNSLMVMKQQVYRHLNMPLGEAMKETNTLMAESLSRPDFREGVRSFIEKRPPEFARLEIAD